MNIPPDPSDEELEKLTNEVGDWVDNRQFDLINARLKGLIVSQLSTAEIILYLINTNPAKTEIAYRPTFFDVAKSVLKQRPIWGEQGFAEQFENFR